MEPANGGKRLSRARAKDGMRGTSLRMRRRGEWHERMGDSIVGVAPTTKYHRLFVAQPCADPGVQPSADNRAGYVVDLAGNIYELLLFSPLSPSASLSLSLFFYYLLSVFSPLPFFSPFYPNFPLMRTKEKCALVAQEICTSV